MTIKELFSQSKQSTDLQALIMMLVFDKQVLSMDDDVSELNLYFMDKHNQRMNWELNVYKQGMNMSYNPTVFEAVSDNKTIYIYAHSFTQARLKAEKVLTPVNDIKACTMDYLMEYKRTWTTFASLIEGKKPPYLLGGYEHE